MRNGYILLHRKGITEEEWRHPLRTLAWIDFCTLAAYEDYVAHDGVHIRRGEVVASYGFLAKRWRKSKGRVHDWIQQWIAERQAERLPERCAERNAERFFIVNYAKYQDLPERVAERQAERLPERMSEPKKRKHRIQQGNEDKETSSTKKGPRPSVDSVMKVMESAFGTLDGSKQMNRRYAWLLIQKAMKNKAGSSEKDAAAGCVALIRAAREHEFWGAKITRVKNVYDNAQRIANDLRDDRGKKFVFIS